MSAYLGGEAKFRAMSHSEGIRDDEGRMLAAESPSQTTLTVRGEPVLPEPEVNGTSYIHSSRIAVEWDETRWAERSPAMALAKDNSFVRLYRPPEPGIAPMERKTLERHFQSAGALASMNWAKASRVRSLTWCSIPSASCSAVGSSIPRAIRKATTRRCRRRQASASA